MSKAPRGTYRNIVSIGLLIGAYFLISNTLLVNPYYGQILILACINVVMTVSLNLINGFTGLFSIGHAGFMAVGAYSAGSLTVFTHLAFPFAILIGGLAAALAGILVGLPTLRLQGDYLTIATLGFGEIIRVIIVNIDAVGGPRGLLGIPSETTFFWSYAICVLTVVFIRNYVKSSHGRACLAIREDEVAAQAMGIDATRYKVTSFTIGAFFAGLAGGLLVHMTTVAHPTMFSFMKSVDYLLMLVVGGTGSIPGSILAASSITVATEALREFGEWRMMVYALLLIFIMLTRPQGLMGGQEFSLSSLFGNAPKSKAESKGGRGIGYP